MIFQSVKMALKSILSNKMRSFLTMLGVIIGVFSLVVLVSLVSGASGKITDTISSLGTDQIDVNSYFYGKTIVLTGTLVRYSRQPVGSPTGSSVSPHWSLMTGNISVVG